MVRSYFASRCHRSWCPKPRLLLILWRRRLRGRRIRWNVSRSGHGNIRTIERNYTSLAVGYAGIIPGSNQRHSCGRGRSNWPCWGWRLTHRWAGRRHKFFRLGIQHEFFCIRIEFGFLDDRSGGCLSASSRRAGGRGSRLGWTPLSWGRGHGWRFCWRGRPLLCAVLTCNDACGRRRSSTLAGSCIRGRGWRRSLLTRRTSGLLLVSSGGRGQFRTGLLFVTITSVLVWVGRQVEVLVEVAQVGLHLIWK